MTDTTNRCWCCGAKLVDSSYLLNTRRGPWVQVFKPTGEMVCPNKCPSKEQAEQDKSEWTKEEEK